MRMTVSVAMVVTGIVVVLVSMRRHGGRAGMGVVASRIGLVCAIVISRSTRSPPRKIPIPE